MVISHSFFIAKKIFSVFINSMKIQLSSNINFNAKPLSKTSIPRLSCYKNAYMPEEAFFVEIEPDNLKDIEALEKVHQTWKNEIFAGKILNTAWMINSGMYDSDFHKLYALTAQKANHANLNPNDILCVMEILRTFPESVYLNYIQGKPDTIHGTGGYTEFKHIGKTSIKCLHDYFKGLAITLNPTKAAEKFYAKIGFKCERKRPLRYILSACDKIK